MSGQLYCLTVPTVKRVTKYWSDYPLNENSCALQEQLIYNQRMRSAGENLKLYKMIRMSSVLHNNENK